MSISDDKKFMEFHLQNGWRYQERGGYSTKETDYIRIRFKDYKKVFDLSGFGLSKTSDTAFKMGGNMLNIAQLQKGADSITSLIKKNIPARYAREVSGYLSSGKLIDSGWKYEKIVMPDSVKSYYQYIPDSALSSSYSRFVEKLNLLKSSMELIHEEYRFKNEQRTVYNIEWHKKFSLPFACLVLFMIGAPLGSIIRKGGLGMPLVIAVVFFLIYHLLNMFGEKLARSEALVPFVGVWLPSLVLLPVGFYLTYKAMHDSQLFNQEAYYRFFRKLKKMVSKAEA
jgi:lipopolysaccharide export system permease protein